MTFEAGATAIMRRVEAEWLDELPAADPRAMRSRRDLRRVNSWMLQAGIMERLLRRHRQGGTPRTLLELGCGDGSFMLRLARRLAPRWPGVRLTLLDRQDIVGAETRAGFRALGWQVETVNADVLDLLDGAGLPSADAITANLFLHHFPEARLAHLFARASVSAPLFVACEPRRSALALAASRLLWAIGCNDVSRHDAVVSVRAGFEADELSRLWPNKHGWDMAEHRAGLFTHCFAARRAERGADAV